MKNLPVMIGAALLAASASWADAPDQFALHRAEFAKYHRMITGRDAPANAVRFAIDPKVSKTGKDAYRIAKAVKSGDRKAGFSVHPRFAAIRKTAKAKPLESLKPTLPRTKENFVKVLREVCR